MTIRCPHCLGAIEVGANGAAAVDHHLASCPAYDRPMSIDDMLAGLGSVFRVGR